MLMMEEDQTIEDDMDAQHTLEGEVDVEQEEEVALNNVDNNKATSAGHTAMTTTQVVNTKTQPIAVTNGW